MPAFTSFALATGLGVTATGTALASTVVAGKANKRAKLVDTREQELLKRMPEKDIMGALEALQKTQEKRDKEISALKNAQEKREIDIAKYLNIVQSLKEGEDLSPYKDILDKQLPLQIEETYKNSQAIDRLIDDVQHIDNFLKTRGATEELQSKVGELEQEIMKIKEDRKNYELLTAKLQAEDKSDVEIAGLKGQLIDLEISMANSFRQWVIEHDKLHSKSKIYIERKFDENTNEFEVYSSSIALLGRRLDELKKETRVELDLHKKLIHDYMDVKELQQFLEQTETEVHVYPSSLGKGKDMMEAVIQAVKGAESNIYGRIFKLNYKDLVNVLKKKAGEIEVVLVMDKVMLEENGDIVKRLLSAGATIYIPIFQHRTGLEHNKYFVVDDQLVEFGSMNYTDNAAKRSNETALIFKHERVATQLKLDIQYVIDKSPVEKLTKTDLEQFDQKRAEILSKMPK